MSAYAPGFEAVLIDPEAARVVKRDKRKENREADGIEAQRMVVEQGGEYWSQWLDYGKSVKQLAPREAGILEACSRLPARIPTERQSVVALEIVERLSEYHASASG